MATENADIPANDGAQPELNDVEQRAMRLGWVPKDQFKGDPDKHRSAEEFLDRGVNMLPLLQRDNEKLHKGMSRLEKRLEEQARTFEEFQKYSQDALQREYRRGKAEAEAKLDTAIQNADVTGAQQARRELAALEETKPQPTQKKEEPPKPQVDPVFQDWIDENKWFNADPVLQAYATKEFGKLERQGAGLPPSELLAETKKRVMDRFPEEFGINPKRENAAAVSQPSGGAREPKKNGKTYENLPIEAKAACNKFIKTIPGYTKEKYLAAYDWD